MCGDDGRAPSSAAEALRLVGAGLDFLNRPDGPGLDGAGCGEVLVSLSALRAKFTAAHAAFLRRFDAADAHDADGYPTSASWLAAKTRMTLRDARADVRRMRQLAQHPAFRLSLRAASLTAPAARQQATTAESRVCGATICVRGTTHR